MADPGHGERWLVSDIIKPAHSAETNLPQDPQRNLLYFLEDGWIYLFNSRRRLCWIPVEYHNDFASWGNRIALRSSKRGLLILTFEDVIM